MRISWAVDKQIESAIPLAIQHYMGAMMMKRLAVVEKVRGRVVIVTLKFTYTGIILKSVANLFDCAHGSTN